MAWVPGWELTAGCDSKPVIAAAPGYNISRQYASLGMLPDIISRTRRREQARHHEP